MPSDRLEGVALVTGGGRGIGASIARELADAGMRVAVTGRTSAQVEAVASEIDGLALVGDVSHSDDVETLGRAAPRRSSGRSTCSLRMQASAARTAPPGRSRSTPGGTCSR